MQKFDEYEEKENLKISESNKRYYLGKSDFQNQENMQSVWDELLKVYHYLPYPGGRPSDATTPLSSSPTSESDEILELTREKGF